MWRCGQREVGPERGTRWSERQDACQPRRPTAPYGDPHGVLAETKAGLDQVVRERAYLLWEQAGRPDGRADDFWHQAQHQRFCERAYALWEREGRPEGKADEYWFRTRAFEKS